jgi:hypothetical protein
MSPFFLCSIVWGERWLFVLLILVSFLTISVKIFFYKCLCHCYQECKVLKSKGSIDSVISHNENHLLLLLQYKLELWVTSLSDTPHLQYYDVQTLEYRYISKLPMKNERIWSYVKETTSHLQNKLTKNIHLGVTTSTRPPFSWKYKLNYLPF